VNIEEIYTPLDNAKYEIRRRWHDATLRKQVESFLGGPPPGCASEPCACLWRAVHTPNREFFRFAEQARTTGCQPYAFAGHYDRYCSTNPEKVGLLRLKCVTGINKRGESIVRRVRIADGAEAEGLPFHAIVTHWGESFIAFHCRLVNGCFPDIIPIDESSWIKAWGTTPKEIYPAVLARFLCHGILFENYVNNSREASFLDETVLPAFETIYSLFGAMPLIVRLLPTNTADHPSWTWYEGQAVKVIKRNLPTDTMLGLSQ